MTLKTELKLTAPIWYELLQSDTVSCHLLPLVPSGGPQMCMPRLGSTQGSGRHSLRRQLQINYRLTSICPIKFQIIFCRGCSYLRSPRFLAVELGLYRSDAWWWCRSQGQDPALVGGNAHEATCSRQRLESAQVQAATHVASALYPTPITVDACGLVGKSWGGRVVSGAKPHCMSGSRAPP